MNNKTNFFLIAAFLLINAIDALSQSKQTPNTSDVKTLLWTYSVSDPNYSSGAMDAIVELEYFFKREKILDKTFLCINIHYKSMEYTTMYGGYRYKLHGKLYTQDVLQSYDSRGSDCFTNITLNVVGIKNLSVPGFSK